MTNQEIIATGQTIANETHIGGNTAERVGGVIEGIGKNLTELSGKLALGAVYDVSAENPTAGPNSDGKWETLSTLLSDANLNTLIPTALRKGGMSIKFIQSSDNKYVQYRLVSTTWSTTVSDWQGVDDEPTAGSSNLVKSGGVAAAIKDVANFFFLDYTTNVAETRKLVPSDLRKKNTTIAYVDPNRGYIVEVYRSISFADGNWVNDGYWKTIFNSNLGMMSNTNIPMTEEGYVYYNGSGNPQIMSSSAYLHSNAIAVSKGDLINVITKGISNNVVVIALCDENGNNLVPAVRAADGISIEDLWKRYEYLVKEDGYVICSYGNGTYIDRRSAAIGRNSVTDFLADVMSWKDANAGKITAAIEILNIVPAYNGRLNKNDANYYFIDLDGTKKTDSNNYYSTSNPIYFKAGDTIHVYTAGRADYTIVAKSSSSEFGEATFEPVVKRIGGSGLADYNYTVTENGYYVICWYSGYASSYAEVNLQSRSVLDVIDGKIASLEEDVEDISEKIDDSGIQVGVAQNVFGDVLPDAVKSKILGGVDDVEIVCVGDSLTGLIEYSGEVTEPEHCPPGMTYEHWTYLLWNRICLNKPVCDRLDSQRNGIDVFTKTGTWSWKDFSSNTGNYRDASVSAGTFMSTDTNAAISFEFDADAFEKLNVVFRYINKGGQFEVVVQEGNGKLLASLDKSNYEEANGYSVNETYSPAAFTMRHRRLWMKKADGVTGTLHITVRRTDTTVDNTLYLWGIEKWNGQSIFVTNIGRGGIQVFNGTTSSAGFSLYTNFYDIVYRNPDLCILEPPLANDTPYAVNSLTTLKDKYTSYLNRFIDSSTNTIKINLLIVLPHGRAVTFDGNQAIKWGNGSNVVDMINHLKYNAIFQHIKTVLSASTDSDGKYGMVDLMQQLYSEGLKIGYTIQEWLTASTAAKQTMTHDGIHLNNLGSQFWCKYLSPLFQ